MHFWLPVFMKVTSDKLNLGNLNQIVLENGNHILLAVNEKCGLLTQAGRNLSGDVNAVYKYVKQRYRSIYTKEEPLWHRYEWTMNTFAAE